ncbi:hypothetical protein BARBAKC583_0549 [Bartonella bacilliformis KC583]|uniref:Uncharacterized protein n=1 Tax=Bartonella bacilliformis (strain ATCC 35685 / KC583 / Herrer 020/F12,63) TaxID=360095 RepID=A1USB0_BARBK|nr:hypothetical protein BARBAKC583_0549 [Bartonella bacilliformis KC583]
MKAYRLHIDSFFEFSVVFFKAMKSHFRGKGFYFFEKK